MRRPALAAVPLSMALLSTLLLSACMTAPPGSMSPPPGLCHAEGARWAIGQPPDQDVVDRVLRDTGSRDARVLMPNSPMTMDHRPDRVNIEVNDRGAITGIRCG